VRSRDINSAIRPFVECVRPFQLRITCQLFDFACEIAAGHGVMLQVAEVEVSLQIRPEPVVGETFQRCSRM
jgi:hypothetical protein